MVRCSRRLGRTAVTPQVGHDQRALAGQHGRDAMPDRMGLRMPMQQQQGFALPGNAGMDEDAGFDFDAGLP